MLCCGCILVSSETVYKKLFGYHKFDTVIIKSLEGINLGIVMDIDPPNELAKLVYYDTKRKTIIMTNVKYQFLEPHTFTKVEEALFCDALQKEIRRMTQ